MYASTRPTSIMTKSEKYPQPPDQGPLRTSELDRGHANFLERRLGEVRLCPGPMGEKFSGSWSDTSRNTLLHNGAVVVIDVGRRGVGCDNGAGGRLPV